MLYLSSIFSIDGIYCVSHYPVCKSSVSYLLFFDEICSVCLINSIVDLVPAQM